MELEHPRAAKRGTELVCHTSAVSKADDQVAPALPKPVEPARDVPPFRSWLSRDARNEHPESKPPHTRQPDPTTITMVFDTTSSQSEQADSTNFTIPKPVEPGREERATRVETTPRPTTRPDHNTPDAQKASTRPASKGTSFLAAHVMAFVDQLNRHATGPVRKAMRNLGSSSHRFNRQPHHPPGRDPVVLRAVPQPLRAAV